MRISYAALAVALGLLGFAAIEVTGAALGLITAITRSAWLDGFAYTLGTLLLALAFAPLFRRARGAGAAGAITLFLLLYAPLVAVIAGVLELTVTRAWGFPGLVRSAFVAGPVNLILTFVLELWFVAVPLGIASASLLRWQARRTRAAATRVARPAPPAPRPRPRRGDRPG
jgi:hypothetical protein